MRRSFLAGLGLLGLLAGCAATPPKTITALDQADFVDPASGDQLHLGLRGAYAWTHADIPASDRNRQRVTNGHWDLLSTPMQLITLDGRIPLRLSFYPSAPVVWRFVPVTLVGRSTIMPGTFDDYVEVQGQWLVHKKEVQPSPDEQAIDRLLSPEARGTR